MKAQRVLALGSVLAWTGAQLLAAVHAECIDYAGYHDWVGSVATPREAEGVALSNGNVCVACGFAGMQIVNVGDPAAPKIIGSVDTPHQASGVAATATYAYVADYFSGVQIIDVRDPESPRIVAALDTPGEALGVAVADDRCYIADGDAGLRIVDVADPATPQLLGSIDTPGSAVDVAISGTLALIADYGGGLRIVDVSNPQSPATVSIVDTPGTAFGVTVSGHFAYVADGQGGLQVIDIAVPQFPQFVGNVSTPRAKDVVVFGQYAYVAADEAGRSGLFVVDVSDPAMPSIVASVAMDYAVGVAVAPPYAYVADWSSGLQVIDVGNLARPPMLGSVATPGIAYGVATSKTHAYVADGPSLQVVDILDPSHPEIVGSLGGFEGLGLAVLSEPNLYAISYAGAYARAFSVISVADPGNPQILGTEYMGFVDDIAVSPPFAYVVDTGTWAPHGGLPPRFTVLDTTNPQDPVPLGFVDLPDYPFAIALSVDHAFVAASSSGLLVFDIATPSPQQVGGLAMANAWAVALSNGFAYVVDYGDAVSNLRLVDVSNPSAPHIVASVAVPGHAGRVVVSGETAYVSAPCSVAIVDVSNPAVPHIIGTVDTPGNAAQIALAGDVMCVASGQVVGGVRGLQMFPVQCGSATGVASSPDRRTGSISIFPNPGFGACTIRFDAPPVGRVRASIHDVAGRLVRMLHDGAAPAGTHDLRWDRLDESGRPVASGVYWARVTTARGAQAEPFVVLR